VQSRHVGQVLTTSILRELLRNLQAWQSSYEAGQVGETLGHDGQEFCLWDVEALYRVSQKELPPRMRQAIHLCLYLNMCEQDAARQMGVSPTNPVASYATKGIEKLIVMIKAGVIPHFRYEPQLEAM
jgi:DNA-directed RNA polymerase specialized sigma24 family protein